MSRQCPKCGADEIGLQNCQCCTTFQCGTRLYKSIGSVHQSYQCRIRELEKQVAMWRGLVENTPVSDLIRAENEALRAVLRSLPPWPLTMNGMTLKETIAAACKEQGVNLEEKT